MSLRDDMEQARAEHFRSRRDYYTPEQDHDEALRAECESEEAEEARWQRIFARQAAEQPAVHYADRPGIDRRVFHDGDIDPHRPDDRERDVPWPAA